MHHTLPFYGCLRDLLLHLVVPHIHMCIVSLVPLSSRMVNSLTSPSPPPMHAHDSLVYPSMCTTHHKCTINPFPPHVLAFSLVNSTSFFHFPSTSSSHALTPHLPSLIHLPPSPMRYYSLLFPSCASSLPIGLHTWCLRSLPCTLNFIQAPLLAYYAHPHSSLLPHIGYFVAPMCIDYSSAPIMTWNPHAWEINYCSTRLTLSLMCFGVIPHSPLSLCACVVDCFLLPHAPNLPCLTSHAPSYLWKWKCTLITIYWRLVYIIMVGFWQQQHTLSLILLSHSLV